LQIKTKIASCRTANSKPVKQEVNGTVILTPLVFPGSTPATGTERERERGKKGLAKIEAVMMIMMMMGATITSKFQDQPLRAPRHSIE
jgi:hypothetical protein